YKNCADYGFILRYPKDKTHITEISYEPWHYRYVGVDHAKIIMEKGICLEEYLSGDY
ncbi:MAG: D-alanyl-D-alanine carboxypeptidase family protein, partial [Angelakisella sp.]